MDEHPEALSIVQTLTDAGFSAYYAGGWVRDFLLGLPSDDIDIATSAPPEAVQALFPRTVPIGISFGIILVVIGEKQYEVASFRQDFDYKDGRRPSRILFCSAQEDARRRDFTINGLFYDPLQGKVLDFVGGREDLKKKIIRAIGDPHERIREDRLRMIRAVRLSCRFGFPIEPATRAAISSHAKELMAAVAVERICQELEKGRRTGKLSAMLLLLHELGLLAAIFPSLNAVDAEILRARLAPLDHYPIQAPLIAFLLPLFPHENIEEQLALCNRLKRPASERDFVLFLHRARTLCQEELSPSLAQWALLYADPLWPLALQIFNTQNAHKARMEYLARSIAAIQNRTPTVSAADLLREGVVPGKGMGELLAEAFTISVNEQIFDPAQILQRLKQSALWPKHPPL